MERKELSRAEIIEKQIRKLLEIDAEIELKGPGTRRVIERILKAVMEGKRGLAFDPKLGRLIFFPRPREDKLAPILKEIEEDPELGPKTAKAAKEAVYKILFGT